MWLDLNYKYLSAIVPDTLRRTPTRIEWLYLTLKDLEKTYLEFKPSYDLFYSRARHTNQVLSTQDYLNRTIPNIEGFEIVDGEQVYETYLFKDDPNFFQEYTYLYSEPILNTIPDEVYFYNVEGLDTLGIDYIVNVQSVDASVDNLNLLEYYLEIYNPIDKKYKINIQ